MTAVEMCIVLAGLVGGSLIMIGMALHRNKMVLSGMAIPLFFMFVVIIIAFVNG